MNMAQVRRQLRQAANQPLLQQCVHNVARQALELGLEPLASAAGEELEVRSTGLRQR